MVTFVEVDRDSPFAACGVRLGRPCRSGLAVRRRPLEHAPHVVEAGTLVPQDKLHAVIPARVNQVLGDHRVAAVPIGVVADVVFPNRIDHVDAPAALEAPQFLADHLESGRLRLDRSEFAQVEAQRRRTGDSCSPRCRARSKRRPRSIT